MMPMMKYARPASPASRSRYVERARSDQPGEASYPAAVVALRRHVLEALEGEYRPVRSIPHAWPVQRVHVRRVVSQLHGEGLLERRPGAGGNERWLYRTVRAEGVTRV